MKSYSAKTLGFLALTCMTFLTPSLALGEENETKTDNQKNRKKKVVSSQGVKEEVNESESNRQDKKFQLTATLTGGGLGTIRGISAGYFYHPNLIFGIRGENQNRLNFDSFSSETKSYGVFAKTFFDNSFYVNYGLSFNTSEFKVDENKSFFGFPSSSSNDSQVTYSRYEKWQHSGIDLSIGNQWQWEHFTLGTDWIGYYKSFQSSRKEYKEEGVPLKSYQIYFNRDHLRALVFYLGSSF